jgi:membrane protease YdiL (CAAX protease family)
MRSKLQIWLFQPIILGLCFILTVCSILLANRIEGWFPEWRSVVAVGTGLFLGMTLFILIISVQIRLKIHYSHFVQSPNWMMGLLFSVLAFGASILMTLGIDFPVSASISVSDVMGRILFQVRAAVIEEIGFRLGILVFAYAFYGRIAALVAGSIPFGVLHLLNFISGEPIYWLYIIGTTIAGLFLSAIFIRYGLMSAIIAHYSWNVLASVTSIALSMPQENIEGSYQTLLILTGLSLFLIHRIRQSR